MNRTTKSILAVTCLGMAFVLSSIACWFDAYPPYYGKVVITRANTYVTVPSNVVLSATLSLIDTNFFDCGDVDPEITADYGGNAADTFHVAWPVSLYVYFFTNSASVEEGGGYDMGKLQYMAGTNSGTSTNWIDLPMSPITNFNGVVGVEGGHFGLITWTPPVTNNAYYLVRVWARLKNGWQSADLTATNIDKNGGPGYWNDYEVLLVKTSPYKKPGARTEVVSASAHDFDPLIPKPVAQGFWGRVWDKAKSLFR